MRFHRCRKRNARRAEEERQRLLRTPPWSEHTGLLDAFNENLAHDGPEPVTWVCPDEGCGEDFVFQNLLPASGEPRQTDYGKARHWDEPDEKRLRRFLSARTVAERGKAEE